MELKERISKLKEIRSYVDDLSYYTKEEKPSSAFQLYDYLDSLISKLKKSKE